MTKIEKIQESFRLFSSVPVVGGLKVASCVEGRGGWQFKNVVVFFPKTLFVVGVIQFRNLETLVTFVVGYISFRGAKIIHKVRNLFA